MLEMLHAARSHLAGATVAEEKKNTARQNTAVNVTAISVQTCARCALAGSMHTHERNTTACALQVQTKQELESMTLRDLIESATAAGIAEAVIGTVDATLCAQFCRNVSQLNGITTRSGQSKTSSALCSKRKKTQRMPAWTVLYPCCPPSSRDEL